MATEWYEDRHRLMDRAVGALQRYHAEEKTDTLYLQLNKLEVGAVTFVVLLEGMTYKSPQELVTAAFLVRPDGTPVGELPFTTEAKPGEFGALKPKYRVVKDGVRAVLVTATYDFRTITLAVTKDKVYILSNESTSR